jgi:drug/metabolite transporter (DMT)-like permease
MADRAVKLPAKVIAALILAIVLDTVTHIVWKLAVTGLPDDATMAAVCRAALTSPFFYAALLAFGAQFVNWMRVLAHADLSYAQPLTALGYVAVLLASAVLLHERISAGRILGVALILAGVYFISRTPHRTSGGAPDPSLP